MLPSAPGTTGAPLLAKKDVTLLFFSDIAWDSLYQRPQHIATRMSRTVRVLWVEPVTLGRRPMLSPVELAPGLSRMMLPVFREPRRELPAHARLEHRQTPTGGL